MTAYAYNYLYLIGRLTDMALQESCNCLGCAWLRITDTFAC